MLQLSSQTGSSSAGTEIKIIGVGATPIAVSTQLPPAVAQLSQQGKIHFGHYSLDLFVLVICIFFYFEINFC